MSKQRRTVSLEPEVDDYLSRDGVNASELVNSLVEKHMNGGATEDQIREFRKKQVKSEYEELASRARRKIEEFNELEQREEQAEGLDDDFREEQLRKLRQVPNDPEHMLVQEVADQLDMTPEEALAEADSL